MSPRRFWFTLWMTTLGATAHGAQPPADAHAEPQEPAPTETEGAVAPTAAPPAPEAPAPADEKTMDAATAPPAEVASAPAERAEERVPIAAAPAGLRGDPDKVETPPPPRHRFGAEIGVRLLVIDDPSFDPYSENDLIGQASVGGAVMAFAVGPFALGLVAEYDIGRKSAMARGDETSLTLHRIAWGASLELRLWRFDLYARLMPAALHAAATLDDPGFDLPLSASGWTWGLDTLGGARFRFASAGHDAVGFWLLAEVGYAFAGDIDMLFSPDVEEEEDEARRLASIALPALDPSGVTTRVGLALSF
jgi:hypothetical protein